MLVAVIVTRLRSRLSCVSAHGDYGKNTAEHVFKELSLLNAGVGDLVILNLFTESVDTTTLLY